MKSLYYFLFAIITWCLIFIVLGKYWILSYNTLNSNAWLFEIAMKEFFFVVFLFFVTEIIFRNVKLYYIIIGFLLFILFALLLIISFDNMIFGSFLILLMTIICILILKKYW
jgi:hypothetical protein